MSEFITELLKRKMIPFGVINGRRKSLSKANPYHEETEDEQNIDVEESNQ